MLRSVAHRRDRSHPAAMTPDDILPTYDLVARQWDAERDRSLFECGHLDRMLAAAPGRRVLDAGCGAGRPIAVYLAGRGAEVTGMDGAGSMLALFRRNFPAARAVLADMRTMDLGRRFDAILAWNSFFHLDAAGQTAAIARFAAHAAPGAALLFTSGPDASERIGSVAGRPVYHSSLSPAAYRDLLGRHGWRVVSFTPEDPACHGHSVWHARFAPEITS